MNEISSVGYCWMWDNGRIERSAQTANTAGTAETSGTSAAVVVGMGITISNCCIIAKAESILT